MPQRLTMTTYLVDDYDRAIKWFVETLGFDLLEDTPLANGKRWVVVAPGSSTVGALLLACAANARQSSAVGDQSGGRVFLFLETDDFARDHAAMMARGIAFAELPRKETYGTVAVFMDLYGNRWDLIEAKAL